MSSLHNQPVVEDIITSFETHQKQSWSKFHDDLCSIPINDCIEKMISENPIELTDEDISVFGLVPRLDNFMLISCSKCSMVVKRDCLQYHYNRRHNDPKNDNFSLRRFILPTVKMNKHKKQKINIRKIPEKKLTYSTVTIDSTDPIALDIIKLEFNEDDFQVKIKRENENHYDSLKYYDDAGDFNLEKKSSSTSTINCNISDWTCKPHNQSLVHGVDDILLNESIIEDADSKLIQLSTAELTIKKELEPICDKSSDPTNYKNTIICVTNSNELLANSIDSSKNYNYMYSGFLFDDYDENYNDSVSSEIECSKSSSYLDAVSDKNAHNITGCNQHSTSSFGIKENIKRSLCDKLMVSTTTSQYLYSDLIKKEFSGDDVPISDQQLITPVFDIKEEYTEISHYSNVVNNECSNNYSITCDQPPGITTTYNINKTKSMSRNLDEIIGISTKNQVIRCKSPSLLLKNPVDVSSRIINTKRNSYHSPGYSQSTANIANKKIKLTSNTEYLDLQTTLSPSYKFVYINDMSSSIKPVNSYNQSLKLTLNQLKPAILNNETQKKLPSCNNSILNEFSEDKSNNDKTKCVQINKRKVVIDNDNSVSRNYQSSSLHQFEVIKSRIISDINYVVNNYDDEQYPKSFINVKDKLKYPLLIDKPGHIYDGISKNKYFKSVKHNSNEKKIDKICASYIDFTNGETNYTGLISDEKKKTKYIHCANTENLCTDFKKEPDEVIQNSQDSDRGIKKIKNEIILDYENIHLFIKKEPDEIVNISKDSTMTNMSDKKEPNEINSDSENINFMNIKEEPYEISDFMTDDENHEDIIINSKHQVIRNVQINKHNNIYFLNNKIKNEEINKFSKGLNTNDEKALLTPSIKYAGIINNEFSDAFINNNELQIPSLSSNVDSKYIPIIDYSDIIIDNETDNFENELHDSELLIINQAQSACIPNSKDLDTISDGSSNNSVTSFDELSSVTSLDNDEIKLISRDCVSDDENSNDSVISDDQLSTVSQDIKKPKSITQSDLILNHINYQKFINPLTWADESIIESLDVLNSKTECINCYNAAGDLLDNYFPVNSNPEIIDDFINSITSDNSSVAITECPVKCSIPVNSNVQMAINYLSPVAQIVKNTTSAKDHELLVCDDYLSSFNTFKWISKSETNHTSFTNCLTHNCIIEKNVCTGNNVKTYSSEPYVDKPKQNENTLNRNTINGSNYINKHHAICKNHFKRITDKSIVFRKHCKIIPQEYNIEAMVKKRLHKYLKGQVVYDKENNNQLIARNLKKRRRVNFVVRKRMSSSDESDDNDNVNE